MCRGYVSALSPAEMYPSPMAELCNKHTSADEQGTRVHDEVGERHGKELLPILGHCFLSAHRQYSTLHRSSQKRNVWKGREKMLVSQEPNSS